MWKNYKENTIKNRVYCAENCQISQINKNIHRLPNLLEKQNAEPLPEEPEENLPSVEEQIQENKKTIEALFVNIRQWLKAV